MIITTQTKPFRQIKGTYFRKTLDRPYGLTIAGPMACNYDNEWKWLEIRIILYTLMIEVNK